MNTTPDTGGSLASVLLDRTPSGIRPTGNEEEALHPAAQLVADALGTAGFAGQTRHLSRDLWRASYEDGPSGRTVSVVAPQRLFPNQIREATEAIEREAPRHRVAHRGGLNFSCWSVAPKSASAGPDVRYPLFRVCDETSAAWVNTGAEAIANARLYGAEMRRFDGRADLDAFHAELSKIIVEGGDPFESDARILLEAGYSLPSGPCFDPNDIVPRESELGEEVDVWTVPVNVTRKVSLTELVDGGRRIEVDPSGVSAYKPLPGGRCGTAIAFPDGSEVRVLESYAEVERRFGAAGAAKGAGK